MAMRISVCISTFSLIAAVCASAEEPTTLLPQNPSKFVVSIPSPTQHSTEELIAASKKRMLLKYPDLTQSETTLSKKVVDVIRRLKAASPNLFNVPNWPEILIESCIKDLREHPPLYTNADVMVFWVSHLPSPSKLDYSYTEAAELRAEFFSDLDAGHLDAQATQAATKLNRPILKELEHLGGTLGGEILARAEVARPKLDHWRDRDIIDDGNRALRLDKAGAETKANFEHRFAQTPLDVSSPDAFWQSVDLSHAQNQISDLQSQLQIQQMHLNTGTSEW